MNEIHIFSRFTIFQLFSFHFLIFKHAQTLKLIFLQYTHGLLISNFTIFPIMYNTNKIPTQKGIYTYKTDFNQHRFTFFISKAPTFELHTFLYNFYDKAQLKNSFPSTFHILSSYNFYSRIASFILLDLIPIN